VKRTELPIPLGYIGLGHAFELAYSQLERREVIEHDLQQEFQIRIGLWGLNPGAVAQEEDARRRVDHLFRQALTTGELQAFACHPDGATVGEVSDREAWSKSSFAFPGVETFIDLDTSPGPDVRGSPVFVERKAFEKWLAKTVRERADPRIRTGRKGRPSVRSPILEEFKHRCRDNAVRQTVTEEARDLQEWFKRNHSITKVPTIATIRRYLRPFFSK
jgi:hypothetical protein